MLRKGNVKKLWRKLRGILGRHREVANVTTSNTAPQDLSSSAYVSIPAPVRLRKYAKGPPIFKRPPPPLIRRSQTLPISKDEGERSSLTHQRPSTFYEGTPKFEVGTTKPCRALIIGINYGDEASSGARSTCARCRSKMISNNPASGDEPDISFVLHTHDNAREMKKLIQAQGYEERNIRLLLDDPTLGDEMQPTKANLMANFKWLVEGATSQDRFFFYYAGHGGQTPDLDGDEADGLDETILPIDHRTNGEIVDDLIHEILIKPLPVRSRLTGVIDCCHSGTILDLPITQCDKAAPQVGQRPKLTHRNTLGSAVSFSSCTDDELAWDAPAVGGWFTHLFIKEFQRQPQQSYRQLLNNIRYSLGTYVMFKNKEIIESSAKNTTPVLISQTAQLYSAHHFDLDSPCVL
ncbi:hypothetical protein BOTBODRAFT_210352 [Botryobasidium botryosum FD-172 SS1]|uniref:Peptidase C14 caspase domain-containing protein n=1 Tax=Botryobasidium botryosum (strain FD-172 SS1) TaxID=930990 RepID=A0A067NC13_BOTB1|nr:hypothetical protein BOTBODRAFT_210352 [Botryobasidium botryosum FD-172 SS1]